jgi:hydroxyacylglutathione hydrolase
MSSEASTRTIAKGVRQVTVGAPFNSYVYLLDGPEGPIAFDAGIKGTGAQILAAAGAPLDRVILSHSHIDHRGGAPELNAPVYCHPDEVADAEGDGGRHYADFSLIGNERVREGLPRLLDQWDGGPVEISDTVGDGDEVAGFRVIHCPGHAPGQLSLFRDSDGLLIAADTVYTLDMETAQPASARVPHPFSNWDTELARESIRRLVPLGATSVWTGHADEVTGDVADQLERAANYGLVDAVA